MFAKQAKVNNFIMCGTYMYVTYHQRYTSFPVFLCRVHGTGFSLDDIRKENVLLHFFCHFQKKMKLYEFARMCQIVCGKGSVRGEGGQKGWKGSNQKRYRKDISPSTLVIWTGFSFIRLPKPGLRRRLDVAVGNPIFFHNFHMRLIYKWQI